MRLSVWIRPRLRAPLALLATAVCLCAQLASAEPVAKAPNTPIVQRIEQVGRMLDAAAHSDTAALLDAKAEIEELPYPVRGDRRLARKLNTSALEKFRAEQTDAALAEFEKAWQADPSDQEIANNYGYTLYRANKLADAEGKLRYTLALAPGRAAAWANLAEVFGAQGVSKRAADAFVISHRFSRNPDVTRQYIEKIAASSDQPGLKDGAERALKKLFPPLANANGSTMPGQALAVTVTERKSVGVAELQEGKPQPQNAAPIAEAPDGDAVPVALRDPMAKLMQKLPTSEVPKLLRSAAGGSAESREALLRLAKGGDARAQNAVANMYDYGMGVETNPELANTWYAQSAAAGFVLAQFSLGYNQTKGIGMAVDNAHAAQNYRLAAEQGHPLAMNNLAICLERGRGTDKDRAAAFGWYMRAAQAGLARGAFNAATYLESPADGSIPIDRKRAYALYRSAANVGFAQAELRMGQLYEFGLNGSVDKEQAIVWYKRAALQGLEPAKTALKQWGIADY